MSNVAQTILLQLGGNRFIAMTGAKNFVGSPDALSFKLPGTKDFVKNGITHVRITLDQSDTYTINFMRVRGVKVTPIHEETGLYADQLDEIFTHYTGLDTSLGGKRRVAA